jgi:hypothetical protein
VKKDPLIQESNQDDFVLLGSFDAKYTFYHLENRFSMDLVIPHLYFGGKNQGKCQISDECSNNERLLLDEMHILKMVVKFCTKLSFTVFYVYRHILTLHF